jgi:hypothetical protein
MEQLMRLHAMMLDHQTTLNSMTMLLEEPQWDQLLQIFFLQLHSLILLLIKLLILLNHGHLLLDVMKMVFHPINGLVIMPTNLDCIIMMELLVKISLLQLLFRLKQNSDQKSNAEIQYTVSQFLAIMMILTKLLNSYQKMFTI